MEAGCYFPELDGILFGILRIDREPCAILFGRRLRPGKRCLYFYSSAEDANQGRTKTTRECWYNATEDSTISCGGDRDDF